MNESIEPRRGRDRAVPGDRRPLGRSDGDRPGRARAGRARPRRRVRRHARPLPHDQPRHARRGHAHVPRGHGGARRPPAGPTRGCARDPRTPRHRRRRRPVSSVRPTAAPRSGSARLQTRQGRRRDRRCSAAATPSRPTTARRWRSAAGSRSRTRPRAPYRRRGGRARRAEKPHRRHVLRPDVRAVGRSVRAHAAERARRARSRSTPRTRSRPATDAPLEHAIAGFARRQGARRARHRRRGRCRRRRSPLSSTRSASRATAGCGSSTSRSPRSVCPRDDRRGAELIEHDVAGEAVGEGRHARRHLAARHDVAHDLGEAPHRVEVAVGRRGARAPRASRSSRRPSPWRSSTRSSASDLARPRSRRGPRGGARTVALATNLLSMRDADRRLRAASVAVRPSSAVHVVHAALIVGTLGHVDARPGVDTRDLAEAPADRVDRVRRPRADPAAAARTGRTASRTAAAARVIRPTGASTARARSRPSLLVRTSSRSNRRTGWNRNSKLHSAMALPDAASSASARASSASIANGLSHNTALPAASAARTCAACRNGGECTLTRSTSRRSIARATSVVVAGRDDVDDLAAVGGREGRRDDAGAEPGADNGDLHSPSTSDASS